MKEAIKNLMKPTIYIKTVGILLVWAIPLIIEVISKMIRTSNSWGQIVGFMLSLALQVLAVYFMGSCFRALIKMRKTDRPQEVKLLDYAKGDFTSMLLICLPLYVVGYVGLLILAFILLTIAISGLSLTLMGITIGLIFLIIVVILPYFLGVFHSTVFYQTRLDESFKNAWRIYKQHLIQLYGVCIGATGLVLVPFGIGYKAMLENQRKVSMLIASNDYELYLIIGFALLELLIICPIVLHWLAYTYYDVLEKLRSQDLLEQNPYFTKTI